MVSPYHVILVITLSPLMRPIFPLVSQPPHWRGNHMSTPASTEWDENDLIMLSALEHYSYCPRQCALIHQEQTFSENLYTIQGHMLHERVNESAEEIRQDMR